MSGRTAASASSGFSTAAAPPAANKGSNPPLALVKSSITPGSFLRFLSSPPGWRPGVGAVTRSLQPRARGPLWAAPACRNPGRGEFPGPDAQRGSARNRASAPFSVPASSARFAGCTVAGPRCAAQRAPRLARPDRRQPGRWLVRTGTARATPRHPAKTSHGGSPYAQQAQGTGPTRRRQRAGGACPHGPCGHEFPGRKFSGRKFSGRKLSGHTSCGCITGAPAQIRGPPGRQRRKHHRCKHQRRKHHRCKHQRRRHHRCKPRRRPPA